jgi:hypothetical protein
MSRPLLELPEAVGRTVENLRVSDDPPYGREVHLTFSDGTRISIEMEIETVVRTKHYRMKDGDIEVLLQRKDRSVLADL